MTVLEQTRRRPATSRTARIGKRIFGPDWREGFLFVAPMVVLIVGLIALPFFDAIRLSFTTRHANNETVFVGWSNYVNVWQDGFFRTSVENSFVFTCYSVLFKVVVGLIAALLLHNLRRGRALLAAIVLLPWVVPTVVTAVTWRTIFDPLFGVLNVILEFLHLGPVLQALQLVQEWPPAWLADPRLAMPGVILVNVWKGLPFFTINFLAGLKAIDPEQYEAAAVDGASAWRRFIHVTLPGLRYVMLVTTLLSAIWTFNNFDLIWLLTQGGPGDTTTPYVLYAYVKAIQQLEFGAGAAVALSMLPVSAILIFVLARYMRRSERGNIENAVDRFFGRFGRMMLYAAVALVLGMLVVWSADLLWRAALILGVVIVLGMLFGQANERLATTGRRLNRPVLGQIPLWVAMSGMLFFVLAPIYWIVVTAFKTDVQVQVRTSILWPQPWTMEQFSALLSEQPFGIWYRNTIFVAVASTVIAVVLSAMAGYALARLRFRGAQGLTGIVLLTYMMPGALLFIPLYQILSDLGMIDSLSALIVTYPTFTLPFASWLLMGFFRSLPMELEEAGLTDGATRMQAFRLIILPLAKPALLAVALFTLTNAWNEFLFAFVFITSEGLKTLPVGLQSMIVGDVAPWGQLMAASILISIPVVIVYAYGQRFLVEGLTLGAVKK